MTVEVLRTQDPNNVYNRVLTIAFNGDRWSNTAGADEGILMGADKGNSLSDPINVWYVYAANIQIKLSIHELWCFPCSKINAAWRSWCFLIKLYPSSITTRLIYITLSESFIIYMSRVIPNCEISDAITSSQGTSPFAVTNIQGTSALRILHSSCWGMSSSPRKCWAAFESPMMWNAICCKEKMTFTLSLALLLPYIAITNENTALLSWDNFIISKPAGHSFRAETSILFVKLLLIFWYWNETCW